VTRARTGAAVGMAVIVGLIAGVVVWSLQISRSRKHLFSRHPWRRLAALGYLGGRPGLDTVRLLTDYVRWEKHPSLRRRGELLLRQMSAKIG
jgi:hypothetical protein